jgi:hypothetical protein
MPPLSACGVRRRCVKRVAAYSRLAAVLLEQSGSLAAIITAEMGKTIGAARAEVAKMRLPPSSGSPKTVRRFWPMSRCR